MTHIPAAETKKPVSDRDRRASVKQGAAVLGGSLLMTGAMVAVGVSVIEQPYGLPDRARRVAKSIQEGRPVSLLQGGEAVLSLTDGRQVHIQAPLVTADGDVLYHTDEATEQAVDQAVAQKVEETTFVQDVTYTLDGRDLDYNQVFAKASKVKLQDPTNTATGGPANYFVIAPGYPGAGDHVAQVVHSS